MTTIDQAFVRAYLQETAPTAAHSAGQSAALPQAVPPEQSAPAPPVSEQAGRAMSDLLERRVTGKLCLIP